MGGVLPLIFPGMLAGLVLSGIHTYLGIELIERRLVFAGLTIAQAAACGSAAAVFAGYESRSVIAYGASMIATTIAAAAIAATPAERRVPKEAAVAIYYVAAAGATAMLASTAAPRAAAGNILSVSLHTVLNVAIVYALVAMILFIVHRKTTGFVFYALAGVVVTPAVAVAGELLVFAYLLIPAVVAIFFTRRPGVRLAIGWATGAFVTAIAILIAFKADLPTGAAVAGALGVLILVLWLTRRRTGTPLA